MLLNSMKIYVAGHGGLVGSAIVRALVAQGYQNLVLRSRKDLDLRIQKDVRLFFEQERPDVVFLCAAKVGGILANNTHRAEFAYDNLMISANIIEAAHRSAVKKLLNLGSSCIYPKLASQPLREESLLTGPLEPTNEPYAIAKISAVKMCAYFNQQYGTNFISAMPTNLYGPFDNFNLESSHVLPALIRKFHLAKLLEQRDFGAIEEDLNARPLGFGLRLTGNSGEEECLTLLRSIGVDVGSVTLWGSGKPRREFLYVDDLAEACLFLMDRFDAHELGELVNVGSGADLTIHETAEVVRKVVGFAGNIKFDSRKPDGTPRKLLDISRILSLGWKSSTPLVEGLRITYDWYCHRPISARHSVGSTHKVT